MINVFKPIVQRDLVPTAYYNNEILQYNGVSPKDTPILPFNQTIEDLNRDIYVNLYILITTTGENIHYFQH